MVDDLNHEIKRLKTNKEKNGKTGNSHIQTKICRDCRLPAGKKKKKH